MKAAAHELKGLSQYMMLSIKKKIAGLRTLRVVLCCVVDACRVVSCAANPRARTDTRAVRAQTFR